jgi:hypothetical protein
MDTTILSALIPGAGASTRLSIGETLRSFGEPALSFVANAGVTVQLLRPGQRFESASPALKRLQIDVDAWPTPPAGLFVVEERRVYLRSRSPMTIAHEFSHGLDCALGGGLYHSAVDPKIRRAFANAKTFVTPYAATGIDEYFAESVRAYVGANDATSQWPAATRQRLDRVDPAMSAIVEAIFERLQLEKTKAYAKQA